MTKIQDDTLFPWERIDQLIGMAYEEDLKAIGDITTASTIHSELQGTAQLIAKSAGVLAGLPVFERAFHQVSPSIQLLHYKEDGNLLGRGDLVAELKGSLKDILQCERTALNFLQHLSGIATKTRLFVDAIQHTSCRVLDTRKTLPGFRWLEKYAVRQGGGLNHRVGLYDMILIKDNHIEAAGGIDQVLEQCLAYIQEQQIKVEIEIEVKNLKELNQALQYPVTRIMLDNMNFSEMRQAVSIIGGQVEVEASGNVTLETIQQIAETGVDFISVGELTHSAPAFDFSLLVRMQ